jgi:hypothetical protein
MKMLKVWLLAASLINSYAANADVTIAEIKNASASKFNEEGIYTIDVEYIIQPCAQKLLMIGSLEIPPYERERKTLAISVVIEDSGIKCMGPLVLRKQTLTVMDVPRGGLVLRPVQPSIQR